MPPWLSASFKDLYASARPVYFPTILMLTSPSGLRINSATFFHIFKSKVLSVFKLKYSSTLLSRPSFIKLIGTSYIVGALIA